MVRRAYPGWLVGCRRVVLAMTRLLGWHLSVSRMDGSRREMADMDVRAEGIPAHVKDKLYF